MNVDEFPMGSNSCKKKKKKKWARFDISWIQKYKAKINKDKLINIKKFSDIRLQRFFWVKVRF